MPPGRIKLLAGRAQFMFNSGVVVDLRAPCEFTMTGPNRGRLTVGTVEAFVPEQARGFTFEGPFGLRIIDLGTVVQRHLRYPAQLTSFQKEIAS